MLKDFLHIILANHFKPSTLRYEELMQFAPYISSFLDIQRVEHEIWVVNQVSKTHCIAAHKLKAFIENSKSY